MAGINAASGNGNLAVIEFGVEGNPASTTALTIGPASFNDVELPGSQLSDGLFTVTAAAEVSGQVTYFHGGAPVPGTNLALVGAGVHSGQTDTNGAYTISDVLTGTYTLTPSKEDDVGMDAITEADASRVLRVAAGLDPPLSADEIRAADVNRDGTIGPMDASYILQYSVALIGPQFPGAGKIWDFNPASRGYALLNSDQSDQDFTAILIGDVTGNWIPPGTGGSGAGDDVRLWLPSVEGAAGNQINLPLRIERNSAEVLSVGLVLTYDPSLLTLADTGVMPGAAATGMAYAANTSEEGTLRIGLAGTEPLETDGILLELNFTMDVAITTPTTIEFQNARINEGAINAEVIDGLVVAVGRLADFDTDDDVDSEDLYYWKTGFGNSSGSTLADGDADGDGDVDGNDFLIWQQNFSPSSASGSGSNLPVVPDAFPFSQREPVTGMPATYPEQPVSGDVYFTSRAMNQAIQTHKRQPIPRQEVLDRIWTGYDYQQEYLPLKSVPLQFDTESLTGLHRREPLHQQPRHLVPYRSDHLAKDRLHGTSRQLDECLIEQNSRPKAGHPC